MPLIGPRDFPDNEAERQFAVERSGAWKYRDNKDLQRILDLVVCEYRTEFGAISIIDGDREIILSRCRVPFLEVGRSESFCAIVIHRPGEAMIVGDAAADPRFRSLSIVQTAPFVRFYAGMPIVDRNGYALGALCVADCSPREDELDIRPLVQSARAAESIIWR